MTAQELWVLESLLGGTAALFAISAAAMGLLETVRGDDQSDVRRWFEARWWTICECAWRRIPETAVRGFLSLEHKPKEWLDELVSSGRALWAYAAVPLYVAVPVLLARGARAALVALVISLPIAALAFEGLEIPESWARSLDKVPSSWIETIFALYIGGVLTVTAVTWVWVSLEIDVVGSALLMLAVLPVSWLFGFWLLTPFLMVGEERWGGDRFVVRAVSFWTATAISFTVTYVAFVVGRAASPGSPVPQSLQMLLVNVVCDGATLVATYLLLRWAIQRLALLRIPVAITLDLVVAGALACASLFLGVLWSPLTVTWRETLDVLVGRSATGTGWELGPLFWAMHTTFLPTLCYLLFLLVAWCGKAILLLAEWFFGTGRVMKHPLKLTAAVFTLLAAVLAGLAQVTGTWEEHVRDRERQAAAATASMPPADGR